VNTGSVYRALGITQSSVARDDGQLDPQYSVQNADIPAPDQPQLDNDIDCCRAGGWFKSGSQKAKLRCPVDVCTRAVAGWVPSMQTVAELAVKRRQKEAENSGTYRLIYPIGNVLHVTQRPASSGVQTTASATGVLQLPDHVCGTRCQYSCGIVTVSDSLNGC